jgi:tRNA(Ile)-lysidine synthase
MRSIVGTGPGGFRSIKYANDDIIRPVLDFSREELQEVIYAATSMGKGCDNADKAVGKAVDEVKGASLPSASKELWREDATNADTDRFRAFVRHEIVPLAKRWNPSLVTTLTRTMNQIADEDDMLEEITDEIVWNRVQPLETQDGHAVQGAGFLCLPVFGEVALPVARRALVALLKHMLGADERIDAASVNAILKAFDPETNRPIGGYVANIQGNLAVSANKLGVRVEPMAAFRARRKKQDSKKQ